MKLIVAWPVLIIQCLDIEYGHTRLNKGEQGGIRVNKGEINCSMASVDYTMPGHRIWVSKVE